MANKKPVAFLEVDPLRQDDGRFAPLPVRNSYAPDIRSRIMWIQQTDNDLKSTAGYHDASLYLLIFITVVVIDIAAAVWLWMF